MNGYQSTITNGSLARWGQIAIRAFLVGARRWQNYYSLRPPEHRRYWSSTRLLHEQFNKGPRRTASPRLKRRA